MASKQRLDLQLVTRGLAVSRQQAQQLIRAGKVRDGHGQLLDKPGQVVAESLELVVEQPPRFVSRGGEKLLAGLDAFPIAVEGRTCLDGGISTGGFTDCLLQHGAVKVYGVDMGYGQTAWSLRTDDRVVLRERTNLRRLTAEELYEQGDPRPTLAVADVSFISLGLVLPSLRALMVTEGSHASSCEAIVLVKPQFEAGKAEADKARGVIRDPEVWRRTLDDATTALSAAGAAIMGVMVSPITGGDGNVEFLVHARAGAPDVDQLSWAQWRDAAVAAGEGR